MILKTMDGVIIPVGQREAALVAQAISERKGHVMIRGALLPCSSIAMYPDEFWAEREKQGRLHDGTRVLREFGRWTDARDKTLQLSWEHYPELGKDEVLTETEWSKSGCDREGISSDERQELYVAAIEQRARALIQSMD